MKALFVCVGQDFKPIHYSSEELAMALVKIPRPWQVICSPGFKLEPNCVRAEGFTMLSEMDPLACNPAMNSIFVCCSKRDVERVFSCVDTIVVLRDPVRYGKTDTVPLEDILLGFVQSECFQVGELIGIQYNTVRVNNTNEEVYLSFLRAVLGSGSLRQDRTGTGTIQTFAHGIKFDLRLGFPLLTTKRMFTRGILEELFMFLRGDTDTKTHLADKGIRIWEGNTTREFLDKRGLNHLPEGSMGKGYGYQWRHWGPDQIMQLMKQLDEDPYSRRHLVSAWNVAELNEMALPPCHVFFQVNVEGDFMDLNMYQRSADVFLGLPFNIASYAFLLSMICTVKGKTPRYLNISIGDAHVYTNHIQQCITQLQRDAFCPPSVYVEKKDSLLDFQVSDFTIVDYDYHPAIRADMAV